MTGLRIKGLGEEIATLAGFVRYWLDDDTEGFRFSSETPNISFRK